MSGSESVIALLLTVACGAVALVLLGLAGARVVGAAGDDERAAGVRLILHGVAMLALAACVAAFGEHASAFARVTVAVGLGVWGVAAMVAGVALARRVRRSDPPEEDDGRGGGGGRDDEPDPEPPWWPEFERDLAVWQAERERAASRE